MSRPPFVSYANNREDVVLARALRAERAGRILELGSEGVIAGSASYGLYRWGWRTLAVQPVGYLADRHRTSRDGDVVLAAAPDEPSCWSEHLDRLPAGALEVLLVGLAPVAAASQVPLDRLRPWIVVAPEEADPAPNGWSAALDAAGYRRCVFDGVLRFWVAADRAESLAAALSYPACSLDAADTPFSLQHQQISARLAEIRRDRDEARAAIEQTRAKAAAQRAERARLLHDAERSVDYWREQAVARMTANQAGPLWSGISPAELERLRTEHHLLVIERTALLRSVSWRATRPLRGLRRALAPLYWMRRVIRSGV